MKKTSLFIAFVFTIFNAVNAQEFKVVTIVESIVPAGVGRSRIIEHEDSVSAESYTTKRDDGKTSKQKDVKRKSLKANKLKETKLLNFFSIAGINFRNIASNDAIISSKMNEISAKGWDLFTITSGVESSGGLEDPNGIFITRLFFKRKSE